MKIEILSITTQTIFKNDLLLNLYLITAPTFVLNVKLAKLAYIVLSTGPCF